MKFSHLLLVLQNTKEIYYVVKYLRILYINIYGDKVRGEKLLLKNHAGVRVEAQHYDFVMFYRAFT